MLLMLAKQRGCGRIRLIIFFDSELYPDAKQPNIIKLFSVLHNYIDEYQTPKHKLLNQTFLHTRLTGPNS